MAPVILYALSLSLVGLVALVLSHSRRRGPEETSAIDIDALVEAGEIDVADTTTVTDLRALALPSAPAPASPGSTQPGL